MGGGNLVATTDAEAQSLSHVKSADDEPGSNEILFPAIVLAILKKSRVKFNFRPQLPQDPILKSIVQQVVSPNQVRIGDWQGHSEGTLYIEVAEAFSVGDGRSDDLLQC